MNGTFSYIMNHPSNYIYRIKFDKDHVLVQKCIDNLEEVIDNETYGWETIIIPTELVSIYEYILIRHVEPIIEYTEYMLD
jgi:hypothetical protein